MTSRGGGGGGGGRDRFRRDVPSSRLEDGSKRGSNPPSRHLWVGNLSHSIGESDLTIHFLRFGELDSVAFQPGRSYAFINFKEEEDAIAAIKALQGFPVAGNPLRIEFAKADKSTSSRDDDYSQRRDEQRSAMRGSPFSQRDSRVRKASPDPFYLDKSRMSDKNAEPSEVLWIGFPALLKVDEMILRKAFSPFGEIEKITVFPGRSYAFVRFRNVMSACRAKETLQGKLFGNPRVHICFARSEAGSSNRASLSSHFKSNSRPGASENFRQEGSFGSLTTYLSVRSPHFISNLDPGDSDVYGLNRKGSFDNWRFEEELGPPPDVYERLGSPTRERASHFHELPQKGMLYEPWDLPDDTQLFHGAKKLKTGSFPLDKELPEYPFSELEQQKHAFPRAFSNFSEPEVLENFKAGSFGYKPLSDHPITLPHPRGERSGHWKTSHDAFQAFPDSLPSNIVERKRFNPEPEQSSLTLWKWEGTVAKGGTPICRARCFPVGKALDIMLPEFLDCTARTGLDMLAKHYYQAASAWVVFFVPASDEDIGYYNEFMNYLGEKQRAAVAKLDDKTTLFLVPPSDFSEEVLKVPGKLSISGVVLKLEHPGSNFGPLHHSKGKRDTNLLSIHGDLSYQKPSTPSGHFPSMASLGKTGGDTSLMGNVATLASPAAFSASTHASGIISDSYSENRHDYPVQQQNLMLRPNWSPHHPQNFISGNRNMSTQASNTAVDPVAQEHHSVVPKAAQENRSTHYAGGISSNEISGNSKLSLQETKPSVPLSKPITGLQPQLAQLASSLLGHQKQSGSNSNISMGDDFSQTNTMNLSDHQFRTAQTYGLQNNLMGSDIPTPQFGQFQQLQQQQQTSNLPTAMQQQISNVPIAMPSPIQKEFQRPQIQSTGTQEEAEADPQKRLQATLQLAAALLQQIQQGKGT